MRPREMKYHSILQENQSQEEKVGESLKNT